MDGADGTGDSPTVRRSRFSPGAVRVGFLEAVRGAAAFGVVAGAADFTADGAAARATGGLFAVPLAVVFAAGALAVAAFLTGAFAAAFFAAALALVATALRAATVRVAFLDATLTRRVAAAFVAASVPLAFFAVFFADRVAAALAAAPRRVAAFFVDFRAEPADFDRDALARPAGFLVFAVFFAMARPLGSSLTA